MIGNAVRTLGTGLVSLALILVVAVGGYNLLALNLGTVTGDYFKGALAVVVLLGGAWLSSQNLGMFGKPFMFAAVLMLAVITVRHRTPGVADLVSQTARAADRQASNLAVDLSAARQFPCDRSTANLKFFDRETGRPLVWVAEDDRGRLVCYDRPGYHPQTRKELVPVDERLATVIQRQEPPPNAASGLTTPTPSARPSPTPLPDLSEGSLPR